MLILPPATCCSKLSFPPYIPIEILRIYHFYDESYLLSFYFILLESLRPYLMKSINYAPSYYASLFFLFRHIDWAQMLDCLPHMVSESFDLCSLGRETKFQTRVIIVRSEMRRPMFINFLRYDPW